MPYVLGSLLVVFLYNLVSTLLTFNISVPNYIDISLLCRIAVVSEPECRAGALHAGYIMLLGAIVAAAIIWGLYKKKPVISTLVNVDNELVLISVLSIVIVLMAAHIFSISKENYYVSRIQDVTHNAIYTSLENLLWPLIAQLANLSKNAKYKNSYIVLTLVLAALSPFRGVLLAILIFTILIPGIIHISRYIKVNVRGSRDFFIKFAMASAVLITIVVGVYFETLQRSSNLDMRGVTETDNVKRKLTQRMSYPLFQAYFAEKRAGEVILPDMIDGVLQKIRLGNKPNLNQFLYSQIYGTDTVGETTSLYYGEAAANSATFPLIWVIIAPIFLAGYWRMLGAFGIECSTIIGIAIWRGSLGGLAEVLPAVFFQTIFLIMLVALNNYRNRRQLV